MPTQSTREKPADCDCKREPNSWIPVLDVKNPICMTCNKPMATPPTSIQAEAIDDVLALVKGEKSE